MTRLIKEEARIRMGSLRLERRRIDGEIRHLLRQFCSSNREHYFFRLWDKVDSTHYRVVSYVCVLCRMRKVFEQENNRCPICNEPQDVNYSSSGNITPCPHCGFNQFSRPSGLLFDEIPRGDSDEIYSRFKEF